MTNPTYTRFDNSSRTIGAAQERRLPGSIGRHAEKAGGGLSPTLGFGLVGGS